jgi:hypothetical protein
VTVWTWVWAEGGKDLGTRMYFVLLAWVSASISLRKDWSSCSASSSRERGLGVDESPCGVTGASSAGVEGIGTFFS